jgi:hypothetical protein
MVVDHRQHRDVQDVGLRDMGPDEERELRDREAGREAPDPDGVGIHPHAAAASPGAAPGRRAHHNLPASAGRPQRQRPSKYKQAAPAKPDGVKLAGPTRSKRPQTPTQPQREAPLLPSVSQATPHEARRSAPPSARRQSWPRSRSTRASNSIATFATMLSEILRRTRDLAALTRARDSCNLLRKVWLPCLAQQHSDTLPPISRGTSELELQLQTSLQALALLPRPASRQRSSRPGSQPNHLPGLPVAPRSPPGARSMAAESPPPLLRGSRAIFLRSQSACHRGLPSDRGLRCSRPAFGGCCRPASRAVVSVRRPA